VPAAERTFATLLADVLLIRRLVSLAVIGGVCDGFRFVHDFSYGSIRLR